MNNRHDVARLRVVQIEEIFSRPRRGDLVRRPVVVDESSAQSVEAGVLVAELNDHCLIEVVDEGQQAHCLRLVAALVHELKSGSVLNRPLRQNNEVLALREAVLILDVVVAAVHARSNFAARKAELNVIHGGH